jgi:DNA-binding GntR family transcriptional regulator
LRRLFNCLPRPERTSAAAALCADGLTITLRPLMKERKSTDKSRLMETSDTTLSLVDSATETIRDRILDLTFAPGELINSSFLVNGLGLSRTPVREALNRLATDGLVKFAANQGVYVAPLDLVEVNDLFEAFRVCEQISARFCNLSSHNLLSELIKAQEMQREAIRRHAYLEASYWNARQRMTMAETSSNRHLVDFYRKTANQMRRLSVLVYKMEADDLDFYLRQVRLLEKLHGDVRKAVESQDRDVVRRTLVDQVDVFHGRVRSLLKRHRSRDLELE